MSININIQQFDGTNYSQLLPNSQSYSFGYEGRLEQIGYHGITDKEFTNLLDAELAKLPFWGAKQLIWYNSPTVSGYQAARTLFKMADTNACLLGWSYEPSAFFRLKTNGVWQPTQKMSLFDQTYAKFQMGSYIGTGTYGESSPNTVSFNFPVKYFMIRQSNKSSINDGFKGYPYIFNWCFPDFLSTNYTYQNNSYNFLVTNSSYADIYLKTDSQKQTLSWYNLQNKSNSGAQYQLNSSNTRYIYLAIG